MVRILKTVLILGLASFIFQCRTPNPKLDGLWISDDERYSIYFENDTLYSKYHYPIPYKVEDHHLVFQDTIYTCECSRLPFILENDTLTLSLNRGVPVSYLKSVYTNTFDHRVNKLGLKLELQTGFSKDGLQSKTFYEFVYVGFENDSSIAIMFNDEKCSLSQLYSHFSTPYYENDPTISIAIAVEKSILITEYLKIHNAITRQDSVYVRMEHAIRNPLFRKFQFNPFSGVNYERFKLNIASELPSDQDRTFDTLSIDIKNEKEVIANGQPSSWENLPLVMDEHYSTNSKTSLITIKQTENLTYGQFLFIHSLNNKIILEHRDQYCLDNYGKTWPEIQLYDLRIEGSQQLADSLRRHVQQEFPHRILVDDW